MSLGVLIGSNITNPLMGVGIGALIIDNPISKTIVNIDLVSWFLISFALYLLIYNKKSHSKENWNNNGLPLCCIYYLQDKFHNIDIIIYYKITESYGGYVNKN